MSGNGYSQGVRDQNTGNSTPIFQDYRVKDNYQAGRNGK